MTFLDEFRIGDIYCLQPSVGILELNALNASIYHNATQDEILDMTAREPLDVYLANLEGNHIPFLRDGNHRGYVIRFHSQNPGPGLRVNTRVWEEFPQKLIPRMEERYDQGFTLCQMTLRP